MSITSRINEMSSHIDQAYDELQGLGADLTNVNKNIENISMVLDDIYDSMPQVSGEGTSLTLEDTRLGKIKSTLKGNISQDGTPTPTTPIPVNIVSGDNEIVVNSKNQLETYNISGTLNGVSYTLQDGVLTLNGTCTSTSGLNGLGIFRQIKGINYKWTYVYESGTCTDYGAGLYMGATPTSTSVAGYGAGFRTSQSRTVGTFNNGEEHTYYLYMAINKNSTFTNYKIKPLIVQGDEYSYDFEPYQGNTYNIDLGGLGKNKFDINSITKGIELNSNTGQTQVNSSWWTSAFIPIKSNHAYTSSNISSNSKCWYDENKNFISYIQSQTATSPANAKYLRVNGTLASLESNPQAQIEEGNSVTTFEAYNSIELCKIGNYQDYFYKDSGKWYLHKEIGKVVLNGSENWNKSSTYQGNYYCQNIVPYALGNNPSSMICNLTNIFIGIASQLPDNDNCILLEGANVNKTIDFKISSISTLDDFKSFLGNTNLILYYVYATPTTTELTYEPLITQLNLLEKAMSKDGQTNISQVNNDLPFIISASALKEWQESASINSTLSMVNPLSLGNTLNTQENNTQPIEVDNIEPLEEEENEES